MEFKPILTYSGAGPLFRSLEAHIASSIPLDTYEWKRSYGRPIKDVRVEASFVPFDTKLLEKYKRGDWNILEHPVLHIYVTECNDVDTYKSTIREEIDGWLKVLTTFGIVDWMIVVVETVDVKKSKNILPRTTVVDKIRTDFGSKSSDRCISLLNPMKFETKASESFRCFLQRIRALILIGYNRNINKYEELIRTNRERRNQPDWCFVNAFLLQERLAFVLEMLGLHTEALVQYDELDAMFSQFVLNSAFGERQKWLALFQRPFNSFHAICMNRKKIMEKRKRIEDDTFNFLEFRSYLFERQAVILNAADKTSEIAERLLPFLFSTAREIELLKIEMTEGALACWEFVCALEVLDICEKAVETKDMTSIFHHSAPIWNLAKDKLYELGKLCGLTPGFTPTSEQLHIVVQLSAGIGDSFPEEPPIIVKKLVKDGDGKEQRALSPNRRVKKSATDRLKEALGTNQSFQKMYLELCELTISTYKHVSRLRFARLVGLELGQFYCSMSEPQKAIGFYIDLLRELKTENWSFLASQTLLELANCYKSMNDTISYTKTCAAISCCLDLDMDTRIAHFDEHITSLATIANTLDVDELADSPNNKFAILEDHFKFILVTVMNQGQIIQDDQIVAELQVESNFPKEIIVNTIALSFESESKNSADARRIENPAILPISSHIDFKQDGSVNCASVVCTIKKPAVRRSSSTRRKVSPTTRNDFTNNVSMDDIILKPGLNTIALKTKATRTGLWKFCQLSITVGKLEFLSDSLPLDTPTFEITTKASSAILSFKHLVAGIPQPVNLIISSGSFILSKEASVTVKCSKLLKLIDPNDNTTEDHYVVETIIKLSEFKPFEEREIPLDVICDLPGQRDEKPIDQKISLLCPWSRNELHIPLHFTPAIIASCRLHSSGTKKFLQVVVKGIDGELLLTDVAMTCDCKGVNLKDLNPKSQGEATIFKNLTVSYLYEFEVEPLKAECELAIIKVNFSLQYSPIIEGKRLTMKRKYHCKFDVSDYITLFRVEAKIESQELCRAGSVCHLNLKIIKIKENPFTDLMYEVLADQNMWAVVGRTAGVTSMVDRDAQSVMFDVMPLSAGFLPLPNIRLSKYISADKTETHPKLQPFPPGQVYNASKSLQVHVLPSNNMESQ